MRGFGRGYSQWPSYIRAKDGVTRLDRFNLCPRKSLNANAKTVFKARGAGFFYTSGGTTAVCFGVLAENGRGIPRY